MAFPVIRPADATLLDEIAEHSPRELEARLARIEPAFRLNRERSFADRAVRLHRAAALLRSETERFARLMTDEMGKPIAAARSEAEKCAWVCEYYADHAEALLAPERVETDASSSCVRFDPLGAVLFRTASTRPSPD